MGAYLYAKLLDKKQALKADDFIATIKENKQLTAINLGVNITCQKDIDMVKNDYENSVGFIADTAEEKLKHQLSMIAMFKKSIGKLDYKVSGIDFDGIDIKEHQFFYLLTQVFVKLNQKFKMKYLFASCAFNTDFDYFSLDNMKAITHNGDLLSGKSICKSTTDFDRYYKLKDILKS